MSVQNSLPILPCFFVLLFTLQTYSCDQMALKIPASDPRNIVIIGIPSTIDVFQNPSRWWLEIGGGVIGCSTAYFLTHHASYNAKLHSVTILEASSIAGGSSGKAGGLLAGKWLGWTFRCHQHMFKVKINKFLLQPSIIVVVRLMIAIVVLRNKS